ncbi:MAG: alpha-E domain-containing protein [Gammaproteobacteria bacterium]|nr:alpha-E domain-containing protein [Gammaproteobacteria bacterium]
MSLHTLSSTAKRSYWLGRYLERAEGTARLVAENGSLLMDLPKRLPLGWQPLVNITGSDTLFDELYSEPTERNVVRFIINERRNPASLSNSLNWARENARTLRGIIPRQAVEYIIELHLYAREHLSEPLSRSRRMEGLSNVPEFVQRIDGFMSANMLHDAHWNFWRLGNFIERADMTSRIIDVGADNLLQPAVELEPFADVQWRSVLRSLNANQSYTSVVQEPIQQSSVLEFLINNAALPRSLTYSLNSLRNCLRSLPRNERVLRALNRLRRYIAQVDPTTLEGEALRTFLDDFQLQLAGVHEQVNKSYFDFKPGRRQKTGDAS